MQNGANDTMYYIQKDHLGSYYCVTGEDGAVILLNDREEQIYSFDPWGRRRNPQTWDYGSIQTEFLFDRGFTGHEHLDKFDLINMNGRVYAPWVGRMLSPDPFVQSPSYSQSYNRYSYASNNPLKYVDPSGYTYGPPIAFKLGRGAFAPLGAKFTMGPRGRVDFNFNTFSNSGFASARTETILNTTVNEDGTIEHSTTTAVVYRDKEGNAIGYQEYADPDEKKESSEQENDNESDNDKINIKDKDAAEKLVNTMKDIHQYDKSGELESLFTKESIQFGKYERYKTFRKELYGHLVDITIINPKYGTDYGYYYQVTDTEYGTFGNASFGTFDIAGQYSVVSIRVYNEKSYNYIYSYIFYK